MTTDFARRADSLHAHGDTAEALRVLSAGVQQHPSDVTARLVLARVCRDTGRDSEARDCLEAALRLDPECPAALFQLSELLGETAGGHYRERLQAREPWDPWFDDAPFSGISPAGAGIPAPKAPVASRVETEPFFQNAPVASGTLAEPRAIRREPPQNFVFPVREEEEEPEIEENSAPHVATVTLAEIYLQQGLKEQAAQIYRQLLERQPEDDSVRRRLQEIEGI